MAVHSSGHCLGFYSVVIVICHKGVMGFSDLFVSLHLCVCVLLAGCVCVEPRLCVSICAWEYVLTALVATFHRGRPVSCDHVVFSVSCLQTHTHTHCTSHIHTHTHTYAAEGVEILSVHPVP